MSVTVTLRKNQWLPSEQPFPVPGRATTINKQGDSFWLSEAARPVGERTTACLTLVARAEE